MTAHGGWLAARQPAAPEDLAARIAEPGEAAGHELVERLAAEGLEALDRARANPGRVRESALDLLLADALLTYACEAALELPEGGQLLESLLARAAAAR